MLALTLCTFLGLSIAQTSDYDCGRVSPEASALVVGGLRARHGELPWHVGIYRKTSSPYKQICGGTLLSKDLVISAAHCFWEPTTQLQNASAYAVAAGKLYRPWDVPHDNYAQRTDVSEILVPELFRGEDRNFADDIALLVVTSPFQLKPYLRPVCLDFDPLLEERQLVNGNLGKVAGWGLTGEYGSSSAVLQVVELPYVNHSYCLQLSPKNYWEYITSEKICAGVGDGQRSLCQGDSGGGLVFPHTTSPGDERYFLRGIVSTSPSSTALCNVHAITSFTRVSAYQKFIQLHMRRFARPAAALILNADSGCVLPRQPPNGRYSVQELSRATQEGRYTDAVLTFSCKPGWLLLGDPKLPCRHGAWKRPAPQCVPADGFEGCALDLMDRSANYSCQRRGEPERPCRDREPPGTSARATCRAPHYQYADTAVLGDSHEFYDGTAPNSFLPMTCQENAWDWVVLCDTACGHASAEVPPQKTEWRGVRRAGEYPWHAGIYRLEGGSYQHVCGATVLSTSVVMTAAHCVWDEESESPLPLHQLAAAGAKTFRDWLETRDKEVQRSEIDRVAIPESYRGAAARYADDIALAFLATPFKLTRDLRPVCLDFTPLPEDFQGFLPGFVKKTNNSASSVLSALRLPFMNASACRESLTPAQRDYLTADKFCAGFPYVNALCAAGSGGALVAPRAGYDGGVRYYARGVAAGGLGVGDLGAPCPPSAPYFTALAPHEPFIRKHFDP